MVRQYDRLIRWYCRRYGRCVKGSTPDDHYSVAIIGAIDAYDTFDPARGVQFRTHLRCRVRAALTHEFDPRREDTAMSVDDIDTLPQPEPDQPRATLSRDQFDVISRVPGREGRLLRRMVEDGQSVAEAGRALGMEPCVARCVWMRAVRRARIIANEQKVEE